MNIENLLGKLKQNVSQKTYGFFVTLALVVLNIVTAILYASFYGKYVAYINWPAVYVMIIGSVVSVVLSILGLDDFATALLALVAFTGFLLYAMKIYGYIAVVMVGIDLTEFSAEFITLTVFFVICLVGGIANIFLKQKKTEDVE